MVYEQTIDRMEQKALFDKVTAKLDEVVNEEFIKSTKTTKGNTQVSERVVIEKIRQVLSSLEITYEEAGSQQSKDFRNVGGIGLNIEIKKTDNPVIYFNDTCPNHDIYYVIFFTGKEYKRTPEKNIPPKLLYINGEEFIKDSPWIQEYIDVLNTLKDKYARGENKKKLSGIMEVYPRPTFKANISKFLHENKTSVTETEPEVALTEQEVTVAETIYCNVYKCNGCGFITPNDIIDCPLCKKTSCMLAETVGLNDSKPESVTIRLCKNMDCQRYPDDWDSEEDTEETYQEGQWKKCCLCDGYFDDDGMGDILYVQEEPNNQEDVACNLCGKSEDIVQMKGCGQYLCGNACDEDEDEDED